jgi:hypothetical protein
MFRRRCANAQKYFVGISPVLARRMWLTSGYAKMPLIVVARSIRMKRILLVALSSLAVAAPLSATITVGFQQDGVNGGAITTVATDSGTGSLAYTGGYGSFFTAVSSFGAPILPQPTLQTNGIGVSSSSAGTLTIYVTQQDLTAVSPYFTSSFTSNSFTGSAQSVGESTYISSANELFGGVLLASASFNGIGTVVSTNTIGPLAGLFSETTRYVISVGDGSASVNNTINLTAAATPLPEPATWAMMICGFGAIGTAMRRRRTSARFA